MASFQNENHLILGQSKTLIYMHKELFEKTHFYVEYIVIERFLNLCAHFVWTLEMEQQPTAPPADSDISLIKTC